MIGKISFNSQRDGILPADARIYAKNRKVSIPNGMEFYLVSVIYVPFIATVSIPNGMEFYGFAGRNRQEA